MLFPGARSGKTPERQLKSVTNDAPKWTMETEKLQQAARDIQRNSALIREKVASLTGSLNPQALKAAAGGWKGIYLEELKDNSSSDDEESRMLNSQGLAGFTNLLFSYDSFQQSHAAAGHALNQRNLPPTSVGGSTGIVFPQPAASNNQPPVGMSAGSAGNTAQVSNGKETPAPVIKPFKCPECDDAFSHLSFLKEHMVNIHRPLPCDSCGPAKPEMKKTVPRHADGSTGIIITAEIVRPKGHPCPECGKIFLWPKRLERHMVMHSNVRPFPCKLCPGTFKHIEHLQKHVKRVHKTDPVTGTITAPSQVCSPTKSATTTTYNNNQVNRKYICPECNKGFESNYKLRRHMGTHNKERMYTCQVCGAGLKNSDGLKKHMAMHSVSLTPASLGPASIGPASLGPPSLGPVSEPQPSNNRNTNSNVSNNAAIVAGASSAGRNGPLLPSFLANLTNPPFLCGSCGGHFENSANLQQHCVLVHGYPPQPQPQAVSNTSSSNNTTPEGLYQCDTCGKNFARKENRRIHETLHTGILPFVCPTCNRGFATNYRLKRHLKTHLTAC